MRLPPLSTAIAVAAAGASAGALPLDLGFEAADHLLHQVDDVAPVSAGGEMVQPTRKPVTL